jgi:hypothetical protein
VEKLMNGGNELHIKSHEQVREKNRLSLLKYMFALKSLIAPLNADAESSEEESMSEEDEGVITPPGVALMSEAERLEKTTKSALNIPRQE